MRWGTDKKWKMLWACNMCICRERERGREGERERERERERGKGNVYICETLFIPVRANAKSPCKNKVLCIISNVIGYKLS
jgi:hypothetical protein